MPRILVVDALARPLGARLATVDVIGAGPRAVAAIASRFASVKLLPLEVVEDEPRLLGDYDLLLVSAMSSDWEAAEWLARQWRRWSGDAPAVIGGPISSSLEALEELPYDAMVRGEAEEPLPRLLSALLQGDLEAVAGEPGVAVKLGGRIVDGGWAPHPPSEMLGYTYYTRIDEGYPLYWASRVYVEVVRGCSNWNRPLARLPDGRRCRGCGACLPERTDRLARLHCPAGIPPGCAYCSVPRLAGPARSRPLEAIVEEVRVLVKRGARRIVLSAPDVLDYGRDWLVAPEPLTTPCTPKPNIDALRELFERLREAVPEFESGEAHLMVENVKACLVTEEAAKLLAEYAPGTPVHIGVETGDARLYRLLGRPGDPSDALKAVKLLASAGLKPYVYFIYGLPWETRESVDATVRLMRMLFEAGAEKVTAYRFTPLPGTALEAWRGRPSRESYRVKEEAARINEEAKRRLLGSKLRVYLVGVHRARRRLVGYPVPHGPVVLVKAPKRLLGWEVVVRVTGVEERMVEGKLVATVRRVAPPHWRPVEVTPRLPPRWRRHASYPVEGRRDYTSRSGRGAPPAPRGPS